MKAAVLWPKNGSVTLEELPDPENAPGRVLVRNEYSLLSAGTERAKLELSRQSLIGKARSRPDQVKQVMKSVKQSGIRETYRVVDDRLSAPVLMGYSSCGIVVAVGEGVGDVRPGERVAVGGGGYANHAELVSVPGNLCVPVPDAVDAKWGAFATLGAIALQGIHQAELVPGSRVGVIGLGLVGQITVRLLHAYGSEVVAIDSDPSMVELAASPSIHAFERNDGRLRSFGPSDLQPGLDAVLITAATKSSDPVELAGELARDRANVVIVGDVGVQPPRPSYYGKELSIKYSRSYGPGRYDPLYEEGGLPYPVGFVPWPQRRNMAEFVRLIAAGQLDLTGLDPLVFPIAEAAEAYKELEKSGPERRAAVLISYPHAGEKEVAAVVLSKDGAATRPAAGALSIGAVGAGSFATRQLFPHLEKLDVKLAWIATAAGLTAVHQGRRWGFERAVSSLDEGLETPGLGAVMVLTRHDSHAPYAEKVLGKGIGLFVEKPLALDRDELERVATAWVDGGAGAMVGFNRRFAPSVVMLKEAMGGLQPVQLVYRVFAGKLPSDHWYFDTVQGGRMHGEVCHFVDTLNFLVSSPPTAVHAWPADGRADGVTTQSASASIEYADGSVALLVYGGQSPPSAPKEAIEVAGDGFAARLDDFGSLEIWGSKKQKHAFRGGPKGHKEEMGFFVKSFREGLDTSSAFRLSLLSTLTTIALVESLQSGTKQSITIDSPGLERALAGTQPHGG